MAADIFATAKTVKKEPKAGGKPATPKRPVSAVFDTLAALSAMRNAIDAIEESVKPQANGEIMNYLVPLGRSLHKRPENYTGVSEIAETSCQMRRRDARRGLNPEELKLFVDNSIPYDTVEEQTDLFYINPAVLADPVKREKVSKALGKLDLGLDDGETLIMHQPGESKHIVSDKSIDAIFATAPQALLDTLVKIATTTATRPTLKPNLDPSIVVEKLIAAGLNIYAPPKKKDNGPKSPTGDTLRKRLKESVEA